MFAPTPPVTQSTRFQTEQPLPERRPAPFSLRRLFRARRSAIERQHIFTDRSERPAGINHLHPFV